MSHPYQTLQRLAEAAVDYSIADPGDAKDIMTKYDRQFAVCELVTADAETRTLGDPVAAGHFLVLVLKTDNGDCTVTVSSAYDQAGSTSLVFDDANDSIYLYSIEDGTDAYAWRVAGYDGVTGPGTQPVLDVVGGSQLDFKLSGTEYASVQVTGLAVGTYVVAGTAGTDQLTIKSTGTAPASTGANVGHLFADFETDDDELFWLSGAGGTSTQLTT